jgi:DNA topoisomerase-2
MHPHWRGFTGKVEKINDTTYETTGIYTIKKNKLLITELPIGVWTQNYKEFLEKMYDMEQAKKNKDDKNFVGYKEYHTDTNVSFELEFNDNYIDTMLINKSEININKTFHLTSRVSINNMHLYSTEGRITKYNTIDDILKEYYIKRLQLYEDRRKYQLDELKKELEIISNKTRFILMVVNDELEVNKRKRSDLEKDLEIQNKFNDPLSQSQTLGYLGTAYRILGNYGKSIDVFVKTIGVVHEEYLVNFNYLDKIMGEYGFSKVFVKPFEQFYNELLNVE